MGPHTTGAGGAPDAVPPDPVAAALDGATRDSAVSGDAMRWSPDLAAGPAGLPAGGPAALPGVDSAAGLGSALGLDGAAVQRLVCGALFALPSAERPQLTSGPAGEPGEDGPAGE